VGILFGGMVMMLLYEVPCLVLFVCELGFLNEFLVLIVVGVDGLLVFFCVFDVVCVFGERLRRLFCVFVVIGGKFLYFDGLKDVGVVDWDEWKLVDVLVVVSYANDFVVVGSCGLYGLEVLGSVSEWVVYCLVSFVFVVCIV